MRRNASVKVAERNTELVEEIRQIKSEHPFWGYRRVWARLKYGQKLEVNRKRIQRLMKLHGMEVTKNTRLRAKRTSSRPKPKPMRPNQWWGIDMTKVMVEGFGWVYIVLVLDWYTKKVVGYHIGLQATAQHWLLALDMGLNRQFPQGVRDQGLHLMADNGSQPTSVAFMKACSTLGVHQAFTSYNNPKGNADTERMVRTLKEEFVWLKEWINPFELSEGLEGWFERDYNQNYLHSSLGYKTPAQTEQDWINDHQNTPLQVA
jgi:putative transposase